MCILEQKVHQKIDQLLIDAQKIFGAIISKPEIEFNLTGTPAGKAFTSNKIQFNKILLQENEQDFIKQTVTHEFCHILAYKLFGTLAHDKYWKICMTAMGVEPKRCHSYSIENVQKKRNVKTFVYKCNCRDNIQLSSIRHNKIVKNNQVYRCNACKSKIVLV